MQMGSGSETGNQGAEALRKIPANGEMTTWKAQCQPEKCEKAKLNKYFLLLDTINQKDVWSGRSLKSRFGLRVGSTGSEGIKPA